MSLEKILREQKAETDQEPDRIENLDPAHRHRGGSRLLTRHMLHADSR